MPPDRCTAPPSPPSAPEAKKELYSEKSALFPRKRELRAVTAKAELALIAPPFCAAVLPVGCGGWGGGWRKVVCAQQNETTVLRVNGSLN